MNWKLGVLILLPVIAAVAAVSGRSSDPVYHRTMQVGPPTKIRLTPGEELREVKLYPDRVTGKHAVADLPDGRQEHFWYRADSTLAEAKTFSKPIEGKRVLLRHAQMDHTGLNYLSDLEFSLEGEVTQRTLMVTPSLSFRWSFFPGGQVKLFESFEPASAKAWKWSKILSDEFFADSRLAATYRRTTTGFEVTRYAPDMTVLARLAHAEKKYSETWFYDDGKSKRRVLEQDSQNTSLRLFSRTGILAEEHQVFGEVTGAAWYSRFYDAKGVIQLEQRWVPGKDGKPSVLEEATTYRNGFGLVKVNFNPETGKLHQVIQYLDGNGYKGADIIFVVRPSDGFLESRHHRDPKANTISLVKYEPTTKEALPVKIEPAWLSLHRFDPLPPQVVKFELQIW